MEAPKEPNGDLSTHPFQGFHRGERMESVREEHSIHRVSNLD